MSKKALGLDNSFAVAISFISNPFFVLPFAVIISNLNYMISDLGALLMFLLLSTIPVFYFYTYEILNHKEHHLHYVSISRNNRSQIYLIGIATFVLTTLLFFHLGNIFWFYHGLLFVIFIASAYLLNKYIDKLSMHAASFAFVTLYMADRINIAFALLFFIIPLVYWSRIKLHKHTWLQLFLGASLGMVFGLLSWTIP